MLLFGFVCGCRDFCHRTESDIFLFLLDITFQREMIWLLYCRCVFLVTKPFNLCHNFEHFTLTLIFNIPLKIVLRLPLVSYWKWYCLHIAHVYFLYWSISHGIIFLFALIFKPEEIGLWCRKCVFLVTNPIFYKTFLPCVPEVEVYPTFKNFNFVENIQIRSAIPVDKTLFYNLVIIILEVMTSILLLSSLRTHRVF